MATSKSTTAEANIEIQPIKTQTATYFILGTRPLIQNRLAEKARQELLLPTGRKTAAQRASSLKHDVLAEYRSSAHIIPDESAPTLLAMPSSVFKGALLSAALRVPGAKKSEIGQLLWVEGEYVPIWGVPELFMSVVRSADVAKTPDVRTRLIVPEWATAVTITFTTPILNATSVTNLLVAAGQICGIGDWRPERGKGTFGQFAVVNADDPELTRIMTEGGRAAQLAAVNDPVAYNRETEELLSWFTTEVRLRGKTVTPRANGKLAEPVGVE